VSIGIWQILIVLVMLGVTLIPTIIAFRRRHKRKWLVLLVSFVPLIGWIVALIWAISGETEASFSQASETFE
jgi:Fe2+ transport system protein B